MNASFYTAAAGVTAQQNKFNVIANNVANVNTYGYKSKTAVFQDLIYANMTAPEDETTNLTAGAGAKLSHTNTNFSGAGFAPTGNELNFAIDGDGFFMLEDPTTGEISYTRNGNFSLSIRENGTFYLATDNGKLVLDENKQPIVVNTSPDAQDLINEDNLPGIYAFENLDGMLSVGLNEFVPQEKNGEAVLNPAAKRVQGYLEQSNVDMAQEMANIVETSRAYSYIMKMMQTSDEVQEVINSLKG